MNTKRAFLISGAIVGCLAVALQFYLIIVNRKASVVETIIRFFSFYTILTNILVALCFTVLFLNTHSRWHRFFSKSSTLTAIAVYITVVGIVYNVLLRFLWRPEGLQLIVDELLHSVIPLLFVLYWLLYVNKKELPWRNILGWLIYPLIYTGFILLRGYYSGFYPYPFIDATTLSTTEVLINVLLLTGVFTFFSLLFVTMGKISNRI